MPSLTDLKPQELVAKILELLESKADHFSILGVDRKADVSEIKRTFVKLARGLHPDLPVFREAEDKERATRAFQAATRAQMILTDPARRAEYMQELGLEPMGSGPQEPNPDLARIHVHRARQLVARRDWQGVEESLRMANALFGDEPHDDCKVELGWAIFNNATQQEPQRLAGSQELWHEVIEARGEPSAVAQAYYYMAIWCKLNGEVPKVKKHLDNCLSINNRHVEAKRELRLFERRRASSADRRGVKGARRGTGSTRRASGERPAGGATGGHSAVSDAPAGSRPVAKKVPLKRRTSLLERIFGKGD